MWDAQKKKNLQIARFHHRATPDVPQTSQVDRIQHSEEGFLSDGWETQL